MFFIQNMSTNFNFLGAGIALNQSYIKDLGRLHKQIDCLEIKVENYLRNYSASIKEIHVLNEIFPIISHGLNLSIGTVQGLRKAHLNKLRKFFADCPYIPFMGEHIGCTWAGNSKIPHFINVPFTGEMVDTISNNYKMFCRTVGIPLILENIPYEFSYPESEMTEMEFIAQICKKTNCGLLLDASNLFANCHNYKISIEDYLKYYPVDRIVQIHFNGGKFADSGRYIDSHTEITPGYIWDIVQHVIERAPVKAVILERDDEIELEAVIDEVIKARDLLKKFKKWE